VHYRQINLQFIFWRAVPPAPSLVHGHRSDHEASTSHSTIPTICEQPAVITSKILITPRYAETNQSGCVAEATYPRWLDMARAALLKEQGMDYRQLEARGYLMPVLEIGLTFHQPAFYDETLQIITTLRSRPTFRIRLDYEVRRQDQLLATGHSVQGFINHQQRPVKPPPEFMAKLELIFPRLPPGGPASVQNSTAGP